MPEEKSFEQILVEGKAIHLNQIPTFESIAPKTNPKLTVEQILQREEDCFVLDVRSEAEYEESHLPGALNFPILDNVERREVGILYKQLGKEQAVSKALDFAKPKLKGLKEFCISNANGKKIAVYCWRGGGRSSFVCNFLRTQTNLEAVQVHKGHKAYRKFVHQALYCSKMPRFLVLTGMTGVGKTEILQSLQNDYQVLDLEGAALHCASSFGSIPYEIRGEYPPVSQKSFEDSIYEQLYLNPVSPSFRGILVESESRRIGKRVVPENLYQQMLDCETVQIEASLEARTKRILDQYVGEDGRGVDLLRRDLEKIRRYLKRSDYQNLVNWLDSSEIERFVEFVLREYYDRKYSGVYKDSNLTIDFSNPEVGLEKLRDFLDS